MTVLKTEPPILSGMNEKLWLEKTCSCLIPDLPLWIIEHAWSKRMMDVLDGGLHFSFAITKTFKNTFEIEIRDAFAYMLS